MLATEYLLFFYSIHKLSDLINQPEIKEKNVIIKNSFIPKNETTKHIFTDTLTKGERGIKRFRPRAAGEKHHGDSGLGEKRGEERNSSPTKIENRTGVRLERHGGM